MLYLLLEVVLIVRYLQYTFFACSQFLLSFRIVIISLSSLNYVFRLSLAESIQHCVPLFIPPSGRLMSNASEINVGIALLSYLFSRRKYNHDLQNSKGSV